MWDFAPETLSADAGSDVLALALPAIRADLGMREAFCAAALAAQRAGRAPSRLPAPLHVFAGASERSFAVDGLEAWRAFAGEDAPCHVSFLAPDVNVEMQNFLGPLLPVARFLKIPVLDFDKYGLLFDAERTAERCVPAATSFLRQYVIRS